MTESKFLDEIFNNIQLTAKVINVYDGDTITIETQFPGVVQKSNYEPLLIKFKVRMDGYDTPEIRTRDDNEKRLGYIARNILSQKILNEEVKVICKSLDKYGRLLAIITHKNENINSFMLEHNYGMVYTGGTKAKPLYNDDNSYVINGVSYVMG